MPWGDVDLCKGKIFEEWHRTARNGNRKRPHYNVHNLQQYSVIKAAFSVVTPFWAIFIAVPSNCGLFLTFL